MATWIIEVLAFPHYERDEHRARTDKKPTLVKLEGGPWYEGVTGALTKDIRQARPLDDEKYPWLYRHCCDNPFRYVMHPYTATTPTTETPQ